MGVYNMYSDFTKKVYPYGFRNDALTLIGTTFAFLVSYVLTAWMIAAVSLMFLAHLGQTQLNGGALALTAYNLIGNSVMLGLNFGCDTLLPQCYGGNKRKMGIILQRGMIIAFYACFVVWTLMLNAKYVLRWIEKDLNILQVSDKFLQLFLPVAPLDALSLMLRMYIASTGRTRALVYMNVIGNVVNILAHYICLFHLNMDIRSAPVSIIIAYASIVITGILYIRFSSIYEETWHPVTRACLRNWGTYLKLALPGVVSIIAECSTIEMSIFFAAGLNRDSLSAQIIVEQVVWLFFLMMSSVGDAGNILIGHYLGANKPKEAANAKNVTFTLAIILIMFNTVVTLSFHYWIPLLYNVQTNALRLARRCLLLSAIFNIFHGMHAVQTDTVKACGMQGYACIILFIGFYFIGLPLSYFLMFTIQLDIFGFWYGMIFAETLTNALLFILIWRFDWNRFSEKALERIRFSIPPTNSATNSLSSNKIDEPIELLPYPSDRKNDQKKIYKVKTMETQPMNEEDLLDEVISDETLSESIKIKAIVLVIFVFMFISSLIYSSH